MKGTALDTPHIAFVGAGNMAISIIGGLIASGHSAGYITAADPFPASLERLRESAPVAVYNDNAEAARSADIVILAVKPQIMAEATDSIAAVVRANNAVVISIAAGVTIASMQARLGQKLLSCAACPIRLRCCSTGPADCLAMIIVPHSNATSLSEYCLLWGLHAG